MSISNRKLKPGKLKAKYENKMQTFFGKIACLAFGHIPVRIVTDKVDKLYCNSCWKELDK